jgi:hypothetical protein
VALLNWLQSSTEQRGRQSGSALKNRCFLPLPYFQLSGRCANKAFTFSSVRWVMAGYNVTDDTARY